MKRVIMLSMLGLVAFTAFANLAGCRTEVEPDDDVELKVDVD